MPTEIKLGVFPHQHAAITCQAPKLLLSGAAGSGKSFTLCVKALPHVIGHPGNLVGLFRKKLADLRITTLRTLLVGDGDMPPVLRRGMYTHQKVERLIHIQGGGDIYYTGFDEEERLASLNLGLALVDQAEEMDKDDFDAIDRRLRNTNAPYRQLCMACNPGPKSHFLYQEFLENIPTETDANGVRWRWRNGNATILTCTRDNPTLPADYHKRFEGMSEQAIRRYYLGEWVTFEGLVYDRFDRGIHVCHIEPDVGTRIVVGVDAGYTNPSVLGPFAVLPGNRIHQLEEFYETGLTEDELTKHAMEMNERLKPECFVVDPSAASLRASFRKAGLNVVQADNEVYAGIQRVQARLTPGPDNQPGLTVEPTCTNTIREYESYMWKDGAHGMKDEPLKADDHAMDATRYAIAYLDPIVPVSIFVIGAEEEKDPVTVMTERLVTAGAVLGGDRERNPEKPEDEDWLSVENDALFR